MACVAGTLDRRADRGDLGRTGQLRQGRDRLLNEFCNVAYQSVNPGPDVGKEAAILTDRHCRSIISRPGQVSKKLDRVDVDGPSHPPGFGAALERRAQVAQQRVQAGAVAALQQ